MRSLCLKAYRKDKFFRGARNGWEVRRSKPTGARSSERRSGRLDTTGDTSTVPSSLKLGVSRQHPPYTEPYVRWCERMTGATLTWPNEFRQTSIGRYNGAQIWRVHDDGEILFQCVETPSMVLDEDQPIPAICASFDIGLTALQPSSLPAFQPSSLAPLGRAGAKRALAGTEAITADQKPIQELKA
jgi:hypothetical protein